MGRLILHIGTHKTGTTTIQRGLSRNRELLEERGVFYPSYDLIGLPNHYAHLGIVNAFSKAHRQMTRDHAIRFFGEVSKRAADYDVTIISAEPFFRHVGLGSDGKLRRTPGKPESYWPARLDYIRDVRAHFPFENVEIAMVVRRQVEYGVSLYQEHVKSNRYGVDFTGFRENFWYRFDYLRQARAWAEVFDKMHVLRFEDLISSNNILDSFGRALNIPFGELSRVKAENISFPPDVVILKRLLARGGNTDDAIRKRLDRILNGEFGAALRRLPKRSLYRDFDDMRAFHDSFSDANELLKRDFLPHLAECTPMFSTDLDETLAFGDEMSPEFLELVLSRLETAS
ncbi:hypothetical protein [Celeribacter neptunius]|uniref:Sulfotransferase family protein n=1 Tax=Celeribacter neptunius TaxID=588602 RepID=A0A1I3SW48_9RHOB|nr:hypothetical protein [Celeribacter neptunius]SFJ62593.1 hypothetical protein SAMN04487991_2605 [Celeribacter neptunius]